MCICMTDPHLDYSDIDEFDLFLYQFQVFFSDLIMGSRIGQGACSSVNKATHRKTGETFAIKLF